MRQIVLDTETTGLEPSQGHRIIEIGCVELNNRKLTGNNYHQYLLPDREIDEAAIEVHGITNEFLNDKPRYEDVADDFLEYIKGAELIIHNAPFDVGFINNEFTLLNNGWSGLSDHCTVIDTLRLARKMHPGQKNNLNALCRRYDIDNSHRELHGALLDAEILADVYLAMTGGQASLSLGGAQEISGTSEQNIRRISKDRAAFKVIKANSEELEKHHERLQTIDDASEGNCFWLKLDS